MERTLVEKDLGVLVNTKLTISQHCALAAKQATAVLGCTRQSAASTSREEILPLSSAPGRPHLEHSVQCKRDMAMLNRVQ